MNNALFNAARRTILDDWTELMEGKVMKETKKHTINPCPKCGRPALIGDGPGNTWQIGCFRDDCDCPPVKYQDGNKRSRWAAIRFWNSKKWRQTVKGAT